MYLIFIFNFFYSTFFLEFLIYKIFKSYVYNLFDNFEYLNSCKSHFWIL